MLLLIALTLCSTFTRIGQLAQYTFPIGSDGIFVVHRNRFIICRNKSHNYCVCNTEISICNVWHVLYFRWMRMIHFGFRFLVGLQKMGPQNLLGEHSPTMTTTMAELWKIWCQPRFATELCLPLLYAKYSRFWHHRASIGTCIFRKIHSQRKISTPNFTNFIHSQHNLL